MGHPRHGGPLGARSQPVSLRAPRSTSPGLLEGSTTQFVNNLLGAGAAVVYAFVVTFALAWIVKKTMGLRVTEEEEYVGLDIAQHGERVPSEVKRCSS